MYKIKEYKNNTILSEVKEYTKAKELAKEYKQNNNIDCYIITWYYQVRNTKDWDSDNIFFM